MPAILLSLYKISVGHFLVYSYGHEKFDFINPHLLGFLFSYDNGMFLYIPAIGFSLCNHSIDADFTATHQYIKTICERVLEQGLPSGVCLNVNFPNFN